MRTAWVLNLDADDELRDPRGYTPRRSVARRLEALSRRIPGLLRPGDVVVEDTTVLDGEFAGRAWCPTPRALARLERAGARVPASPPLEVLQHVNHRAFAAALPPALSGTRFVRSPGELRQHVAAFAPGLWMLKRPFGCSGRGNRRVRFPHPDAASLRWIEATLGRDGGLLAEPWVAIEREFAVHGELEVSGEPRIGAPTVQECDARGGWIASRRAVPADPEPAHAGALRQAALEVARALHAAGYFGPFGIDAYLWRDAGGARHFNPRGEVNSRYTMGWHVGMGRDE